jgi:hypothetical protein
MAIINGSLRITEKWQVIAEMLLGRIKCYTIVGHLFLFFRSKTGGKSIHLND